MQLCEPYTELRCHFQARIQQVVVRVRVKVGVGNKGLRPDFTLHFLYRYRDHM